MSMKVNFEGNLVADPELRFTPKGAACCNFKVAVPHWTRDSGGEFAQGEPQFIPCTAWETLAENLAESCRKGQRVMVVGAMRARSFEGRDGQTHTVWEVTADDVGPSLKWMTAELTTAKKRDARD